MDYSKIPLSDLAKIIRNDWGDVSPYAEPYLEAMTQLQDIDESYGLDSGASVVGYLVSNVKGWKGEKAREIKKYLRKILKDHYAK